MTEVYICDYIRTPIGRFGGALAMVRADDLGAVPLRGLMARNAGIDSVAVGYGAQSMERLLTFEPKLAIDSFPELRAWLGRQAN